MRILVVDDDAVARLVMRGMVTSLGHECALASSGQEAWKLSQASAFDVVITDRVMPGMDGLELCRNIRSIPDQPTYVYVVLASALGQPEQAREGMLAGADDYLTKPLQFTDLERKLIAAERVTRLHRQVAQVNDRLRRTNQQLATANRLQADMIAMLSHDARQPLAAIIGFTEATIHDWDTTADDRKRENVTIANRAAMRLDQLIEDVLTMANLESGTLTCRTQPVPVAALIQEAIAASADRTPVQVTGDISSSALVDPWHLGQILNNLIGNAIKYGRSPIAVNVQQVGDTLEIQVHDSGDGVPKVFVPHLFERFTRAETGVATTKSGTGLGLYIVGQLVEANGGRISYQPNTPGSGACFTVTLPLATVGSYA